MVSNNLNALRTALRSLFAGSDGRPEHTIPEVILISAPGLSAIRKVSRWLAAQQ
jgi:hypothetical protein